MTDVRIDLARRQLALCLDENPSSFEAVNDQVDRAAELVDELGGLDKLTEYDRAKVSHMIETQIGLGISRGDFDFVFGRRRGPIAVPEFQIARLELKPGDTVVMKSAGNLGPDYIEAIKGMASSCFPNHRLLILAPNLELYVLGKAAP